MTISTNGNGPSFGVGFHPNMPAHVYHSIDAVSASRLKKIAKSPAHLKWDTEHPEVPTAALVEGFACHHLTLERDTFDDHYAVAPECDRRTTKGKETWAEFSADNRAKTIITSEQYFTVSGMAAALRSHPDVAPLLKYSREREITGIWRDKETGLIRKMRADAIDSDAETVWDLKTTISADRYDFERTIFAYRYHWSAAQYLDGLAALGRPMKHYLIVAVEKKPPYGIRVFRLKDHPGQAIDLGRKEIRPLLHLWKACKDSDIWPGYPTGIEDIGLPNWAINRIEQEVQS